MTNDQQDWLKVAERIATALEEIAYNTERMADRLDRGSAFQDMPPKKPDERLKLPKFRP